MSDSELYISCSNCGRGGNHLVYDRCVLCSKVVCDGCAKVAYFRYCLACRANVTASRVDKPLRGSNHYTYLNPRRVWGWVRLISATLRRFGYYKCDYGFACGRHWIKIDGKTICQTSGDVWLRDEDVQRIGYVCLDRGRHWDDPSDNAEVTCDE